MHVHALQAAIEQSHLHQLVKQAFAELGVAHHLRQFLLEEGVGLGPVDSAVDEREIKRHELGKIPGHRILPRRVVVVCRRVHLAPLVCHR
jgi:hypothetical protein